MRLPSPPTGLLPPCFGPSISQCPGLLPSVPVSSPPCRHSSPLLNASWRSRRAELGLGLGEPEQNEGLGGSVQDGEPGVQQGRLLLLQHRTGTDTPAFIHTGARGLIHTPFIWSLFSRGFVWWGDGGDVVVTLWQDVVLWMVLSQSFHTSCCYYCCCCCCGGSLFS